MYAKKWVHEITHELEEVDPANKEKYEANEKRLMARLDALNEELKSTLAPLKGAPYIVFHDAYQYFEKRYGLNAIGSVTLSPEKKPGAARLVEIRKKVRDSKSICVFSEPQFQPKLVKVVMEGTGAGNRCARPSGREYSRRGGRVFHPPAQHGEIAQGVSFAEIICGRRLPGI